MSAPRCGGEETLSDKRESIARGRVQSAQDPGAGKEGNQERGEPGAAARRPKGTSRGR